MKRSELGSRFSKIKRERADFSPLLRSKSGFRSKKSLFWLIFSEKSGSIFELGKNQFVEILRLLRKSAKKAKISAFVSFKAVLQG